MGYFDHKHSMQEKALSHIEEMDKRYPAEIESSVKNGTIYNYNITIEKSDKTPFSVVTNEDTVSAIMRLGYYSENKELINFTGGDKKICALNFSSYKNPGGKFIEGSSAQEESLCHESTLYNCLEQFDNAFYAPHRKKGVTNKALYYNEAIYLPNIVFEREGENVKVDVLTCAAPNWSAAFRYYKVTPEENAKTLKLRINFIKAILEEQKVDVAILGAYGCGVFGQPPELVAKSFKETFATSTVSSIVYAIPRGINTANYDTFKRIIEEK